MTTDQFNALPLEARRFIETNAGCLGCGGNKEAKLQKAYDLYLINKTMSVYQLFGGGINYNLDGQRGVLYGIKDGDSPEEIREKIRLAKLIHAKNAEVFIVFDTNGIEELLASLPGEKVVEISAKKDTRFKKKEVIEQEAEASEDDDLLAD